MKILVACEYSGTVRDAFIRIGHDAVSCDFLPTESPGPHYQGDVADIIHDEWDMLIAFPPCTYLCSSGLHWNSRTPGRSEKTERALQFVHFLMNAPIQKIAIENPIGCIGTRIRPQDQIIQPHQFGHDASKSTCLWLKGLPRLTPTKHIAPRMIGHRPRWANQTDSGQNKLPPSKDRWKERSVTYKGIAEAMAEQWGTSKVFYRQQHLSLGGNLGDFSPAHQNRKPAQTGEILEAASGFEPEDIKSSS